MSHLVPQPPLTAHLFPHGTEQSAAELLNLIDQEGQEHQHHEDYRQMLLPVPVVVLIMISLILQGVVRLVLHLPASPSASHHLVDDLLVQLQMGHPTEGLNLAVLADLPI